MSRATHTSGAAGSGAVCHNPARQRAHGSMTASRVAAPRQPRPITLPLCGTAGPDGEIGRRSGLKIRRFPEKGRAGSTPAPGTSDGDRCRLQRVQERALAHSVAPAGETSFIFFQSPSSRFRSRFAACASMSPRGGFQSSGRRRAAVVIRYDHYRTSHRETPKVATMQSGYKVSHHERHQDPSMGRT